MATTTAAATATATTTIDSTPSLPSSRNASPVLEPARDVPTTWRAGLSRWWSGADERESALSEQRIFSRLPFFVPTVPPAKTSKFAHLKSSSSSSSSSREDVSSAATSPEPLPHSHPVTASTSLVQLGAPGRYLNTLSITPVPSNGSVDATLSSSSPPTSRQSKYPPTVILPGYGAGIGFFYPNLETLGKWVHKRQSPVYAVDWLGMGRSARVPFSVRAARTDVDGRVREAEDFFLDALEEWRVKQGLDKMVLVGHSLGAYLSTAYALRYPQRVTKLILLSPAGVPRHESVVEDAARNGQDATKGRTDEPPPPEVIASVAADPEALQQVGEAAGKGGHGGTTKQKSEREFQEKPSSDPGRLRRMANWMWEEGWSPFAIVRNLNFWGPILVGKYTKRRFAHLPEEEIRDMNSYLWAITAAKGSGEYCISHLLAPGAHARRPLVDRVQDLKIPITFVYGDHDWMDEAGGRACVEVMQKHGNPDGRSFVIENAGHHLYLDNPDATNELLLRELKRPSTIQ